MPQVLTTDLADLQQAVEEHARGFGLDFFDIVYEVLDWEEINEVAAFGGYPARYPHWRFGMEFVELSRSYAYGLSKIYEMVINNDPTYAYLLTANHFVDQKLVMAHVCGHGDFFKHNFMFAGTNRKMLDEMANHATRVRRYMERHGADTVERFLDDCLSLENLIDYSHVAIPSRRRPDRDRDDEPSSGQPRRLRAKGYMDSFINPPAALEAERERLAEAAQREPRSLPEEPVRDVLLFLQEHAPLERWQRDVIGIVREEAYYFAPQGRTKIMNEGWASYWHSRLMTEKLLEPQELVDYADHHSGTMATGPGRLNPYKLGIELWRDIEQRWDKGRHGADWAACDDYVLRERWDSGAMEGRSKIFEVRRHYNDVTFIDEFLTPDLVRSHGLFTYDYDARAGQFVISDRDFAAVKERLLFSLTNFGQPAVELVDANYLNRGELLLVHRFEGVPLKLDQALETLEKLYAIWKRPVNLETAIDGEPVALCFDGAEQRRETAVVDRS
ncbi:MAG: SpoVR family protein [Gemmatimonadota bacterium]